MHIDQAKAMASYRNSIIIFVQVKARAFIQKQLNHFNHGTHADMDGLKSANTNCIIQV
jgi:hypothetical protein